MSAKVVKQTSGKKTVTKKNLFYIVLSLLFPSLEEEKKKHPFFPN